MKKLIKKYQNANQGKLGYHIETDINGNRIYVANSQSGSLKGERVAPEQGTTLSTPRTTLLSKQQAVLRSLNRTKTVGEIRAEDNEKRRNKERERRLTYGYGTKAYYDDIKKEEEKELEAHFNSSVPGLIANAIEDGSDIASAFVPGYGFGYGGALRLFGWARGDEKMQRKGEMNFNNAWFPTTLFLTGGTSLATPTQMYWGYNFGKDAYEDIQENGLNAANGFLLAGSAFPFFRPLKGTYNTTAYTINRLRENPKAWYAPGEYIIGNTNTGKRAIELAMKSDGSGVPINQLLSMYDPRTEINNLRASGLNFNTLKMLTENGVIQNDLKALKYIFGGSGERLSTGEKLFSFDKNLSTRENLSNMGKRLLEELYYMFKNNGAKPPSELTRYTGAKLNAVDELANKTSADLVRTYLFGENPGLRLTKGDFGFLNDYVRTEAPNTKYVYHTDSYYPYYSNTSVPVSLKVIKEGYVAGNDNKASIFPTNGKGDLDVAGHLMEYGVDENGYLVVRGNDAWRFKPKPYLEGYKYQTKHANQSAVDFGLHAVDNASNGRIPITRTNWTFADVDRLPKEILNNPELKEAIEKNRAYYKRDPFDLDELIKTMFDN